MTTSPAGSHTREVPDVFAGLPDVAAVLGGVGFANAAVATEWAELLHDLRDDRIPLPARTTDAALQPWVEHVRGQPGHRARDAARAHLTIEGEWSRGTGCAELIRAGLCVTDLAVYGAVEAALVSAPVPVDDGPEDVEWALMQDLRVIANLDGTAAGLGVRGALGWLLLFEQSPQAVSLAATIAPWAEVGLAGAGWLYAAAGFTPDEALAGIEAGTPDDGATRMMAALRGVRLPV